MPEGEEDDAEPTAGPTLAERPSGRRHGDTDPVPLADLEGAPEIRYWSGVEIARGGMGRVVEATDTLLGRTVALKEALATDPESLRRFTRETKITARLEHPGIVPVYDAGTTPEGTPYYVMRKVSGRPLDRLVKTTEELAQRLALLPHVVAAVQAVAHAHERGVIHRDLKPANILVGHHGETVVIDWGLAKVVDEPDEPTSGTQLASDSLHTRYGTVLGTPGFMSPEQIEAHDVDARSDVYALGATLYYVLSRRPPHRGDSSDAVVAAAKAGPPRPIGEVVGGVPRELATIIDKALAYDRATRYPHAGALATDLENFLAGQIVASHNYSAGERLRRFVRRNRLAVGIAVAAVVALVALGWFSIDRVVAARDEAVAQARAAEEARTAETERATELTLSQARLLLDTNPSAAIAFVRPLATGEHWRDVRGVVAQARASGVAWRLPSADMTLSIAMAPDGLHAATTGGDGLVRVYDLMARTGRTVMKSSVKDMGVVYLDDAHLVLYSWTRSSIVISDLTGTSRNVEVASPVVDVVPRAGALYWVDHHRQPWWLAAGESTPHRFELDDVTSVQPSPDGTRIAIATDTGMFLVDHGGKPIRVTTEPANDINWTDADDLVVVGAKGYALVDVAATPPRVSAYPTTVGDAMFFQGTTMTSLPSAQTAPDVLPRTEAASPLRLHIAGSDALLASDQPGRFTVYHTGGRPFDVLTPSANLDAIATSPKSRFVLTAERGRLLLWDLDAILPRTIAAPHVAAVMFGPHYALLTKRGGGTTWVDLRTGSLRDGPALQSAGIVASHGTAIAAVSLDGHIQITRYGSTTFTEVADDALLVGFLDDRRLEVLTHSGNVLEVDTFTNTSRTLIADGNATTSYPSGPWLLAALKDGTLWRYGEGKSATHARAAHSLLSPDGTLWYAQGVHVGRWLADGTDEHVLDLGQPVTQLLFPRHDRVLAATDDRNIAVIDHGTATEIHDFALRGATYSHERPLVAGLAESGVRLLDVDTLATWRIAPSYPGPVTELSDDATVLASSSPDLFVWPIDLPDSPEATVRWIDDSTNARWDPRTHAVTW